MPTKKDSPKRLAGAVFAFQMAAYMNALGGIKTSTNNQRQH